MTCGHDRNAYVWNFDSRSNSWKHSLVILRISRAATTVKWSPSGKKFAVASGAKVVPVCHYEADNDWWVSSLIKKHKSTILSLAWHPNSKFLLTGCADYRARIFSAYLPEIDQDSDSAKWSSIFPQQNEFGECLWEFDESPSWIEGVAFSPSGSCLSFVSHDSAIYFAQLTGSKPVCNAVNSGLLPFLDVQFLSENCVVAVGYDCNPMVFTKSGEEWNFNDKLDKEGKSSSSGEKKTGIISDFKKNISKFKDSATKGVQFGKESKSSGRLTIHQNTVSQISVFPSQNAIVTTGLDGRIQFWDLSSQKSNYNL